MAVLSVAPSSAYVLPRSSCLTKVNRSKAAAPKQREARRCAANASFSDTGYALADSVSKVADKADKVVGSVDAPGWVLPVA